MKIKTFVIALAAAMLIAGQWFTPVSAAPAASALASELCGDTYTVKHLDNLTKIADYCDTTVDNILSLNPQITNPNIIFTGQVLRLTGKSIKYSSTYTVRAGDTLAEIAEMFGITVQALQQANPSIWSGTYVYAGQVLNIPRGSTNTGYTGNARVTLSATYAEAGDEVTVYVSGFPANSYIDYRVGEKGEDYTDVYDGTVSKYGTDSITITIPDEADDGEDWVVVVTTTSQRDGVEVTSPTLNIED